jgi:hypothetical protein
MNEFEMRKLMQLTESFIPEEELRNPLDITESEKKAERFVAKLVESGVDWGKACQTSAKYHSIPLHRVVDVFLTNNPDPSILG